MKSLLLGLLGTLLLAGCGKDFCALGFIGSCSQNPIKDQNGQDGTLDVRPSVNNYYTPNIKMGQTMQLNVTGGKKIYYASLDPTSCGQVDKDVTTFVPAMPVDCTLTVVDSSSPSQKKQTILHIYPASR